jgi:hypothetical protein
MLTHKGDPQTLVIGDWCAEFPPYQVRTYSTYLPGTVSYCRVGTVLYCTAWKYMMYVPGTTVEGIADCG